MPHQRPPIPTLIFLPLLLCSSIHGHRTFNSTIPSCPNVDCGNGLNITYPFWVYDPSLNPTSICGYKDFKVTCSGTRPFFLSLVVKELNTTTRTLSLIPADNYTCPMARDNFSTFVTTPLLKLVHDTHLVFFYHCESYNGPDIPEEYHATCLKNVSGVSYVFNGPDATEKFSGLYDSCKEGNVVWPVMSRGLSRVGSLGKAFGEVMNGGFDLNWREHDDKDCRDCERSGGRCGFDHTCFSGAPPDVGKLSIAQKIGIGTSAGGITIAVAIMFITFCLVKVWTRIKEYITSTNTSVEEFLTRQATQLPLKRYQYSEIEQMTNHFSSKLGQGGYGTVYKGQLQDGTQVAVKIVNETIRSSEEFINEIACLGSTNHKNVVTLLGFCSQGSKRALIHEFMPNGSLEKLIGAPDDSKERIKLGWEQLHMIALGIAKGLNYIHRGCLRSMIHFDIKPHNILLDNDLCPKISDFGLAILDPCCESSVKIVYRRGTYGYIAPELMSGIVSSKLDVYSYGMMLLEMVGVRNLKGGDSNGSEVYFPNSIYRVLEREDALQACGFMPVGCEEIVRKMILVGLWCIQRNPDSRPSMNEVVVMLERSGGDLPIPPRSDMSSPERS